MTRSEPTAFSLWMILNAPKGRFSGDLFELERRYRIPMEKQQTHAERR